MNAHTGRALSDVEHVRQSVINILFTAIGSRIMRRDYGSLLPALIDQPLTAQTRLQIMSATAMALWRWEPRLQLTRVVMYAGSETSASVLDITATYTIGPQAGQAVSVSIPWTGRRA